MGLRPRIWIQIANSHLYHKLHKIAQYSQTYYGTHLTPPILPHCRNRPQLCPLVEVMTPTQMHVGILSRISDPNGAGGG